jgi:VWFA-related protein
MANIRIISALMLLVFVSIAALSQQPAPSSARPSASPTPTPMPAAAHADDETDVVRIRTNLVQIDAVVVDKAGNQLTDLAVDDFEVYEDGKRQTITNFSYVSNVSAEAGTAPVKKGMPAIPAAIKPEQPRRIVALVVDDLGLSNESISPLKKQLRTFIDTQMQPNDLAAIVRTGGEMGALQQFTTDKRLLHRAVDRLRRHQCSRVGWTVMTPVSSLGGSSEISLCARGTEGLSARALSFVVQGLAELPGRKAMVVFSDNLPLTYLSLTPPTEGPGSGDRVSREPQTISNDPSAGLSTESALMRIAEKAIRASVVIYAVDTSGVQPIAITAADNFPKMNGVRPVTPESVIRGRSHQLQDSRAGADLLATETGGFLIKNSNDFQLPRVMKDQEGYYLIGYRPTEDTFNRRYHHLRAGVKISGAVVRTRDGFFGVTDAEAQPQRTARDRINLALMSPFAGADIDVDLTALFVNTVANGSELHSWLYFPARELTFSEEPDGWHQAVFDLSGIIFGDNGTVVKTVAETRTLRLRRKAYDDVLSRGLVYRLVLPVPKPGSYQFRVALRDASTSRIGSAGQFVEVPDLKNDKLALSGITASGFVDSNDASDPQSNTTRTENESMSGPSRRKFRTPSNLYYGYVIYNAQLDKTQHPTLVTTMRITREGKIVFEGQPTPVDVTGQTDLQRIIAGSGLQLGTEMTPGEYILQIIVTDMLAKEKQRTETQWIDFEIVK